MKPSFGVREVAGIGEGARATVMRLDRCRLLFENGIEIRNGPLALAGAIAGPTEEQERSDRVSDPGEG